MVLKKIFVTNPLIAIGKKIEARKFKRAPILIVASPRSGTTLLLSILSAVPTIFAIPKQTYAFDKWESSKGKLYPSLLYRLYREFVFRHIPVKATRWLEKTPGHIRSIDKIIDFFGGNVRLIHIIRDGRDVTVSTHPAYTEKRKYWVSAERWAAEVGFGLKFKDHPCVYTLRYEDLVSNFEPEMKKLLNFIDEPFTEEIRNWIDHTQIKASIHWGDSVKQIHTNARGKWEKPEHNERINEFNNTKEAVSLLKQLGY